MPVWGLHASLSPAELRAALDDAGIRHRLPMVPACFSGGSIPALATPDSMVISAARHDRTSSGCGDAASATWFGRALLVESLNRDGGLLDAFACAQRQVARREAAEGHDASYPQIHVGEAIRTRLLAWEAALERGPALPCPARTRCSGATPGHCFARSPAGCRLGGRRRHRSRRPGSCAESRKTR